MGQPQDISGTSIFIYTRSALFAEGLRHILRAAFGSTGVHVRDPDAAAAAAPDEAGGLVLLDAGGHQDGGTSALPALLAAHPAAPAVVLADRLDVHHLAECMEAGARGYLLKEISDRAFVDSLRLVLTGERVFPSRLADVLQRGSRHCVWIPARRSGDPDMSARERQVLSGLVAGESNKMIARRLGVTDATVKVHLRSIMRKTGSRNRTQVAIWAASRSLPAVLDAPRVRGKRVAGCAGAAQGSAGGDDALDSAPTGRVPEGPRPGRGAGPQ